MDWPTGRLEGLDTHTQAGYLLGLLGLPGLPVFHAKAAGGRRTGLLR